MAQTMHRSKGVVHGDEPAGNDYVTLQPRWALQSILVFWSSLVLLHVLQLNCFGSLLLLS